MQRRSCMITFWRGDSYDREGEKQLADYLNAYGVSKGYLLSFSFHKNKKTGIREVTYGEKTIVEVVV